MEFTSLRELHKSMSKLGIDMQQFQVKLGIPTFDCLFSTREEPFKFSMTSRGDNPRFFLFDVEKGYRINTYLGDKYYELLEVLKRDGTSRNKFSTNIFFAELNNLIPQTASPRATPNPTAVASLRKDLDESDKPYFDTWIYWSSESGKGPTIENMEKTLVVLGKEAHAYSKRMNASSKWSIVDTGRDWKSERR